MNTATVDYAADVAALFQEWCGYLVSGDTSRRVALALVGPPRTGKTTLASAVATLLGSENVAHTTPKGLTSTFGLAGVVDRSVMVIQGGPFNSVATSGLLGTINGERLLINVKYGPITWQSATSRVMFMLGTRPTFAGPDAAALTDRLLVLDTSVQAIDLDFIADLATDRPGVAAWAAEGLDRLNRVGDFTRPILTASTPARWCWAAAPTW